VWAPYQIGAGQKVRSLQTPEGLGDRLRLVAFAERQAFHAFQEAAERFTSAPQGLIEAWRSVAQDELRHESWLIGRLLELGQTIEAVPVSLDLYHSLAACEDPEKFALYVADAENRGKIGAEKFAEVLATRDPVTAKIFAQIALEERHHMALVQQYFHSSKN
jgi:uncharacterized ferritin-like protein (DUF455 family)